MVSKDRIENLFSFTFTLLIDVHFFIVLATENRARAIQHSQAEHPLQLVISDGYSRPLKGLMLFFTRQNVKKELKIRNMHEVRIS